MTNEEILESLPEKYTGVMTLTFLQRKGECYECWFNGETCNKLTSGEEVLSCPKGYCWRIMRDGVDITKRDEQQ